jgi:penicillin-binding protein 2
MRRPFVPPSRGVTTRLQRAIWSIGIGFLILLLRLWYLQILEGHSYQVQALNNHLRLRPIEAPRGAILDRNGDVLVENRPAFDLYGTPGDVWDPAGVAAVLAGILQVSPDTIEDKLAEGRSQPYRPLLLQKDLDEQMMVAVEERKLDLPGISVHIRPTRAYPDEGFAANLLGYVSEVTQAQLQQEEYRDLRPGESLGQAGVERRFDEFIRGVNGGEEVVVNAQGRVVQLVNRIEPRSGANLYLTIDAHVQAAAEAAFAGKKGAVIAMNPATGGIVALVSRPAYDPNLFAEGMTGERWQEIIADPGHPMHNRAFQAQYPPGSIFKLIVAIAGLESGALTPETRFNCPEHFYLGKARFDDWKKGGHGILDLKGAITQSANTYFYQAGLRIGIEPIVRMARAFGLGEAPGLDLGDEAKGHLPTPRPSRPGHPGWSPADTVITSIGQGPVVVSPLQLLEVVSAIANGGTVYRPRVVDRIVSLSGEVLEVYGPEVLRQVSAKSETLAFIRQAMLSVVEGGTGTRAKVPGLPIAGKTGTAQVVKKGAAKGQAGLKDHGWFASFAPVDHPQLAVVVLVENGGFGGLVAAPVAKAVYEAAFGAAGTDLSDTGAEQVANPDVRD